MKILGIISICVLATLCGIIAYNECFNNEVTVIVDLKDDKDPFIAIPQLLPPHSAIKEVREVDRSKNEFKLKFTSRKERRGLLDWILRRSDVENASFKDPD